MTEQEKRDAVVREALTWCGTKFHDCVGIKGVGVDCAYFIVRVFNAAKILSYTVPDPPRYSPQMMLHSSQELYVPTLLNHTREITEQEVKPGDVVVYKVGRSFSHGGIVVEWPNYLIHPIRGRGVIGSHAAEEGFLWRRARRYFSLFK